MPAEPTAGPDPVARQPSGPREPSVGTSPPSRVRLDELLDRVGDVVTSRERLRTLLDAVVSIGSDLDLRSMLERITRSACHLTDARYAALGVIGPRGRLIEFITYGLTSEQYARIGDLPRGHGVLGLLIDDPRPVRLRDIAEHDLSYGFPEGHPVMRSFLGVPVQLRNEVFGNLYLTEKRGADEFTEEDEGLVIALAAAAGVAIENARLYTESNHRREWLEAAAEITEVLLDPVDRGDALHLVARRAREVSRAGLVLVLLHDADTDQLVCEVVEGSDASVTALTGVRLPVDGTKVGEALRTVRSVEVDDLAKTADWPVPVDSGAALLVPLGAEGAVVGVLAVAQPLGQSEFTPSDISLIGTFAGHAALALERARSQQDRQLLAVLADRERIARDLHDVVIQRLFAAGLKLQTAQHLAVRPEVAERIDDVVDDLDTTIRDLRQSIFKLRGPVHVGVRTEITTAVDDASRALGFAPTLVLDGPLDTAVPPWLRNDLVAVLREALSNVIRHANAHAVTARVAVTDGRLTVAVTDDGIGVTAPAETGGLRNLRERATGHAGTFTLARRAGGGTVCEWTVPIG